MLKTEGLRNKAGAGSAHATRRRDDDAPAGPPAETCRVCGAALYWSDPADTDGRPRLCQCPRCGVIEAAPLD